jgi:hypothetical protein
LKAAVRGLASGEKDYEKYKKLFQEKFVFLNEYTTSVEAEHAPRGPEGPYRFEDRSVPVILFKRWDGKTLIQQLGFNPDPEQAKRALAQLVDKALKENGPVLAPKALRPLLRSYESAERNLEKGLTSAAIRDLEKVVKAAADDKKVPEKPEVAAQAAAKLAQLAEDASKAIEAAAARAAEDPDAAKKELNRIAREYRGLDGIDDKVKAALDALQAAD